MIYRMAIFKIARVKVDSSTIASVGYDPLRQMLDLEFKRKGDVYRYYGVSIQEHQELIHAPSIGAYVNQKLKPAGHPYEIILPEKRPPQKVTEPRLRTRIRSKAVRKIRLDF
jgi:hypothetical protein